MSNKNLSTFRITHLSSFLLGFAILFLLICACVFSVNAGDNNIGKTYSWSPDSWDLSITYTPTNMWIKAKNIKFSNNWRYGILDPFKLVPTFDLRHLEKDESADAKHGYWSTNLLSPHHDIDDDNGDGFWEEAEVAASMHESMDLLGVNYIDTEKSYYYTQVFFKTNLGGRHTGHINFTMQKSFWDPGEGEFQTWPGEFDVLDRVYFDYTNTGGGGGGIIYYMSTSQEFPLSGYTMSQGSDCLSTVSFESVDRYNALRVFERSKHFIKNCESKINAAQQAADTGKIQIPHFFSDPLDKEAVDELLSELETTRIGVEEFATNLKLSTVYGGITFNNPLPISELEFLLIKYGIKLDRFEGHAFDRDDIVSFGGRPFNGLTIKSSIIENIVPEGAEIQGIHAIWGWIPANSIDQIVTEKAVMVLDLRAFETHVVAWLHYDLTNVLVIDYEFDDLYWNLKGLPK